jgi:hypothetical protein
LLVQIWPLTSITIEVFFPFRNKVSFMVTDIKWLAKSSHTFFSWIQRHNISRIKHNIFLLSWWRVCKNEFLSYFFRYDITLISSIFVCFNFIFIIFCKNTKINKNGLTLTHTQTIYINHIFTEWKRWDKRNKTFNIYRHWDTCPWNDQVILADLEDTLQTSIHKLETVISKYGLKIFTTETKKLPLKE